MTLCQNIERAIGINIFLAMLTAIVAVPLWAVGLFLPFNVYYLAVCWVLCMPISLFAGWLLAVGWEEWLDFILPPIVVWCVITMFYLQTMELFGG